MKVMVLGLEEGGLSGYTVVSAYLDNSNAVVDPQKLHFNAASSDFAALVSLAEAQILAYATLAGYSITSSDIVWGTLNTVNRSFNNSPSVTIQTSTGAVGTQISATRDAFVNYSPTIVTTASISGNASDVVVLEICATNSATAGDWKEINRVGNAQALSLAITLQSIQTTYGSLTGIVPAGWYRKVRSITSGTVTTTFTSGQEVLE